jgi:hypothetical protein
MSRIRAGVATVDFTPRAGLPLMGNFRDEYAARGVHDPLMARAIVFQGPQGAKAALLAVDICMLDRQNVSLMRHVIRSQCDVPAENVMIHATHTHSGPAASGRLGMETETARYREDIEAFLTKAASAVSLADRALGAVTLAVGCASEERVSFNRRLRRRDGTTQMNWEALQPGFDPDDIVGAWGAADPELECLTVQRQDVPAAAIVNFALHPAILAGDNWLYSADYPGYLAEGLSRTVGGDFTSVFLNGCCGDVNHIDYRDPLQGRGYQMAQRVGYMLAAAAHQAVRNRTPFYDDRIAASRAKVTLQRRKIGPDERQWCEQVLEQARKHPPQGQVDGVPDAYYAKLRLQMWEDQDRPDDVEVMVIRIGEVAVVGLPGEAFCQLGLEIKRRSPARHTLVAGLCNDAIGYLPVLQSFEQGGYETTTGSTFYEPGSAERLVESAVAQLSELFS